MNVKPKHLGFNCSDFESFVTGNHIYVDKTKIIYELITASDRAHFYFVSRPRRFGKSLFISTLKEIYAGRKELFAEYWIGKHSDYEWPKHPVIHLDFSGIDHSSVEEFKTSLCFNLQIIATQYGIQHIGGTNPGDMLRALVIELSKQGKVVLLVDEYDKPLVHHLDNLPLAEECRKILSNFYTTVKSLSSNWHAIFITGVSKFAKTSLFSGLNNLKELSFDSRAAELFGYTYADLSTYFSTYIDTLAIQMEQTKEETLAQMKEWYNGYRFCDDMQKPQMYNPFSVTACLDDMKFANYWFNTGNPGFLIQLLRKRGLGLELPDTLIQASFHSLNALDINNIPLYTLLAQTGYLTIVDYDTSSATFMLDYPNREVRESFKYYLMQANQMYMSKDPESERIAREMAEVDKKNRS